VLYCGLSVEKPLFIKQERRNVVLFKVHLLKQVTYF